MYLTHVKGQSVPPEVEAAVEESQVYHKQLKDMVETWQGPGGSPDRMPPCPPTTWFSRAHEVLARASNIRQIFDEINKIQAPRVVCVCMGLID